MSPQTSRGAAAEGEGGRGAGGGDLQVTLCKHGHSFPTVLFRSPARGCVALVSPWGQGQGGGTRGSPSPGVHVAPRPAPTGSCEMGLAALPAPAVAGDSVWVRRGGLCLRGVNLGQIRARAHLMPVHQTLLLIHPLSNLLSPPIELEH